MKKPTLRSVVFLATCVATISLIVAFAGAAVDDVRWKSIGIGGGGNMFSAAISPADPNIVLMGSDVGGFFRSSDGGQTWQLKNEAQAAPDHHDGYGFAGTFLFDDLDPNIVYAGRMKSHDAGVTWVDKIEFRNITVGVNAIDPDDHSIVYGAGYGNVYKSLDAWESSWVPHPTQGPAYPTSCLPGTVECPNYNTSIHSLVIDPQPPHQLLACALNVTFDPLLSGLYLSDTGGVSWTLLTPPSLPNQNPGGTPRQLCNKLALHKGSRTLYMTLKTTIDPPDSTGFLDIESWNGGVYKSTDWGTTWCWAGGTDGANVLLNPGFETAGDPTHPAQFWNYEPGSAPDSVFQEQTESRTGSMSNAIKIDLSEVSGDSPRSGIQSDCLPVDGSLSYKVSGWAKVSNVTGLSLFSTVVFYDDTCVDPPGIKHYSNGSFESVAVQSYDPVYDASVHHGWRRFERIIHPPEGATRVRFWVVSFEPLNHGTTWIDDVAIEPLHSLPRKTYLPGPLDYREIVVDQTTTDPNIVAYVGTASGQVDITDGDVGGIYKTTDGGANWELVTRTHYRDNVMDGRASSPFCGNGFCQGRWEDCNSCPEDCGASPCCGNNVCETTQGETIATCEVDCPLFTDSNRTYYEIDGTNRLEYGAGGSYGVNSLAIGSGPVGHETLHFGAVRSTDGGMYWTEVSSNLYTPLPGESQVKGTWQARGDQNDVFTYSVVTDPRVPARVYYGDTDNRLMVSYNSGKSFAQEGWDWRTKGFGGDAATAIVLDPISPDTIYLGIANGLVQTGNSNTAIGVFDSSHASGGKWNWSTLGTVGSLPDAGGVGLIRNSVGTFYATVFGLGVYKLLCPSCSWETLCSTGCDNWIPKPATPDGVGWELYPIAEEPTTQRIYVGAGVPGTPNGEPRERTGVWELPNGVTNWTRISFHDDLNPTLDNNMNSEPVGSILPYGPNTLFAATGPGPRGCTVDGTGNCPVWDGDGGLYRAERNGSAWTWTRVIHQPIVSGIDVSPFDSSILYAFAGQVCCSGKQPGQQAGIYKSINGGRDWTPNPIANQGLMNLGVGRLYFSASNQRMLYASTNGDGVFEGTINCADPVRYFDCATRINTTSDPAVSPGSMTSPANSYKNIGAGSIDDYYQNLLEGVVSGKRRLTAVWTLPISNSLAGVSYKLRVEGYRNTSANDTFVFSVGTRDSGTCTGTESYTTAITLSDSADLDVTREGNAGVLPVGANVFCVKVVDQGPGNDTQPDTLTVDRLFLVPLEPTSAADETDPPFFGTIFSGSFVDAQAHDEQPTQASEVLKEAVVGNTSQLSHAWTFENVPIGSSYKLHFEGSRPGNADGDDFQFYWGTSPNGPFTSINGARISSPTETPGGSDSSTFVPTNFMGTLYINIRDTNRSNNKKNMDTVLIDHLEVLRVP